MAVIKKFKSKVGVDASYHRVIGVNINYLAKKIVICVASYIDVKTREKGFNPLEIVDIEVNVDEFNKFIGHDSRVAAYKWLKENVDGFDNSKDDLRTREKESDPDE